jgi:NADPH-dependent 2,4-dienoyl-CoA reductase/sulfur reductase-like enzyme
VPFHSLRDITDFKSLANGVSKEGVKNVTIIGGGFIGMELASAVKLGYKEANVTVIESQAVPLTHVLGDRVGKVLQNLSEKNGVKIITNAKILRINGNS